MKEDVNRGGENRMLFFRIGIILTAILLFNSYNNYQNVSATENLDKQWVQNFLESAYKSQYSLTEKHHSWDEAKTKLTVYMSDELANELMMEHLFLEDQGYIFYGTDFSAYIVPSFSYNNDTTMIVNDKLQSIYIYEKFTGSGPVTYDEQYEVVTIKKMKTGWKISSIYFGNALQISSMDGKVLDETNEQKQAFNEPTRQARLYSSKFPLVDIDLEPLTFMNKKILILQRYNSENSKRLEISPFHKYVGVLPNGLFFQGTPLISQLEKEKQKKYRMSLFTIFFRK